MPQGWLIATLLEMMMVMVRVATTVAAVFKASMAISAAPFPTSVPSLLHKYRCPTVLLRD